jgi:pimeloyl-ACP methyl ester carboxylesterase
MAAVFIHGVPDTGLVWDRVRSHLKRTDVIALSLPGFGAPVPEGFTAVKEEYVDWILARLEQIEEPVDLVGHDWGCIFTARIVSLRSDLIRSWAVGSGPVSANYSWHPIARIWQTPGDGERWMAHLDQTALAARLHQAGVPSDLAQNAVSHMDSTMRTCILRLYRSAIRVGAEWQPDLARVRAPGLVFWGMEDSSCPVQFADELAADTRARCVVKLQSGHWTLLERAEQVAQALEDHWNAVAKESTPEVYV